MSSISYDKSTLSNGLDLILHEDHSLPMVAINVWYHVGSKNDEVGRTGFAHLFEHLMFEGSKHHNKSFFDPLQKAGANLNGSTTPDRTNYWINLPSNYLELALWLEADRMGFLLDALDQKRFEVQRDVVKNERRQSYENRPYGMTHLLLQPAVFPPPHPYSWPTIGSMEDLNAANLEDIKTFFGQYYAPSNASLAIAGDISTDEVKLLVERYFGDIPPGPPINRIGRMDSDVRGQVSLTMRDKVQLPRLYLVWPTVPLFDGDQAALDMLSAVLGDGKSSRLYRTLVYEKQIARDVVVSHHGQEIAGEFHFQATANPGHTLEEIESVVLEELDRIRQEPPSERELERARNRVRSTHIRQLERSGGFGGRADQLNYYNTIAGDPGLINTDIDRYMAVSPEDLRLVATTALRNDRVRLAAVPEEDLQVSAVPIDRTVMPTAGTLPSFRPPVPSRNRLANGLSVLLVRRPELPMVACGLLVRAGAMSDTADLPGLAHMTASMLSEGTSKRTSMQIADEMEFLGSHLASDASREYVLLSAESLTAQWPDVLSILADVAIDPTFPEAELERVRKERLVDLKRVADNPTAIAARASRALLYGPSTGYGHPMTGTEESVGAMTRDGLISHHKSRYGPQNATLIVVGDVSEGDLLSKAEACFEAWEDGYEADNGTDSYTDSTDPTTIYLADKPGAAQSVIRAGFLTIPRGHPDYYTLTLLNNAFGGDFSARLNMNLRQDKGYSYGYHSTIEWLTGPSALVTGGGVQTAVTKDAIAETLKEFADIKGDRPVTLDEFSDSRDGILRGLPGQFETQHQVLQLLTRLVAFDLPDDYFSSYIDSLNAVSLDDVNRLAKSRLDDGHLKILVVGDRSVIELRLRELDLPIVSVDYEGHPLP